MKRTTWLGAVLMSLVLASPALGAGTIRGTIVVPRTAAKHRDPLAGVAETVLSVDEVPDKLELKLAKKAPPDAWVSLKHGRFDPPLLAVPLGTTVHFVNHDRGFHNVFSISPVRKFDLGKLAPGESRLESFDRTGEVTVFCELHPKESATLLVVANHAFVRPDGRGSFVFPKLPPGRYTLRIWHPRYGERTRAVEVPRRGDARLTLRLGEPA